MKGMVIRPNMSHKAWVRPVWTFKFQDVGGTLVCVGKEKLWQAVPA